ncbi:MAG TPA: hypothetical protein DCY06_02195 [Bacteroidetes bacterium]|nr:hypothetical protein [Bacteroidota bacterium]
MKEVKIILFFLSVMFLTAESMSAQIVTWQKILDNNYGRFARAYQLYDNNFIAVGSDIRGVGYKIYLAKYSFSGDSLWTQIIGNNNFSYDGNWVINDNKKGFIICGSTNKGNLGDGYLLNTDSIGNVIWSRSFNALGLDQSRCVKQAPDNGYIVLNRTVGSFNNIMLIKTNENGDVQWQKIYHANNNQFGQEVIALEDSYVIIGAAYSDVYLLKVNLNGDTLWSKRYGSIYSEYGFSIQLSNDNGFIIGGVASNSSNMTNSLIVKTDSLGNMQWQRSYTAIYNELLYSARNLPGIGYIFCGTTDSVQGSLERGFIRIIDFNGNVMHEKFYRALNYFTEIKSVESTNDNGFILSGVTQNQSGGQPKMYLAKTDSLGNIHPVGISNLGSEIPTQFYLYQNYPNPFNSSTVIEFDVSNNFFVTLSIYDIKGKLISKLIEKKLSAGKYKINYTISEYNLSSGLYFYRLDIGEKIFTRRMIYLK